MKARSKDGPHADAAYRVIRRSDEAFGVEVTIPESYPTTFASAADAEAWVAALKQRVAGTPVVRLLAEKRPINTTRSERIHGYRSRSAVLLGAHAP